MKSWRLTVLVGLALTVFTIGVTNASAAGSASISIERTNGLPQNSGAATEYNVNFTCSAVGSTSCGEEPTIRIPLVLTSALGETPPMNTWKYTASSGLDELIETAEVVGNEYVIKLNPAKVEPGESITVQLSVTPPNGLTPNGTTWSLKPEFETSEIPVVKAPAAATGESVATSQLSVSKKTLDEGAVYVRGHQVTFNITAQCAPGAPTGKLYMTEGDLFDTLPKGLEYVSTSPPATSVVPGPGGETLILWEYPDGASMPPGCGDGSTGTANYQVVANVPTAGTDGEHIENTVVFGGVPIDEPPKSTEARVPLTLIDNPPNGGELGTGFLSKASEAPLCIEGGEAGRPNCYAGTYAGHWIQPASQTPALTPGSAEGRFEVDIRYPASRAYETALADPLPCLDEFDGTDKYSSKATPEPVTEGTIPICAHPAFHTTVVRIAAPSLAAAVTEGWRPEAVLTDGTFVKLTLGSSGYFTVPAADVPKVATIYLPPNPSLTDNKLHMDIFGYADSTLVGGDILSNTATATAYAIGTSTPVSTARDEANIYIEPTFFQLGISKSFGSLSSSPDGKTQLSTMSLVGALTVPPGRALTGPVIFADLLPEGMAWTNPVGTATFTVTNGLAAPKPVTGTIERIANYEELGRELIRVTLPAASFENGEVGGFFTIRPPSGLFRMSVPNETATFNNEAQIFLSGVGNETQPTCRAGEGTGESEFQSTDPMNLSGTGVKEINFCQATAELKVAATGGPNFSLRKFVQGELDENPKAGLGIGETNRGGTGVYTLSWRNNGKGPLKNAVIYDILPFEGDTGIVEGETGNARGSEFATEFVEAVGPLPAGVTVEYSESTHPCRPEVDAAASTPPACVEDWTTTVPADATKVKSLRFRAAGPFPAGEGFQVNVKVKLPSSDVNIVAWNSAATDAETTAGGHLNPAEPPKVGIRAKVPKITPTISTAVSSSSILPEREVFDKFTVGNTDERHGEVHYTLFGPIAPVAGSCEGLTWAGAPVFGEGQLEFSEDLTEVPSDPFTPSSHGCYAFETTVSGPGFNSVTSAAGTAGEVFLVHPAGPTLETTVSSESVLPETEVTDSIKIEGTEGFPGTVHWKLLGPVAPVGGSCEGVEWSGAATLDFGVFNITGDGATTIPPDEVTEHGCYGYEATLEGPHLETVTSPIGTVGETVLVHPAVPVLNTAVSSASLLSDEKSTDAITITETKGYPGTVSWRLAGPIPPAAGGSCQGLDWKGAPIVAKGKFTVGGDGTVPTPAAELTAEGCYGYEASIEGEHLVSTTSPFGTAGETLLVHGATPTIATAASPGGSAGTQATDKITIGGTSGFAGTVHWKLVGPLPAVGGACSGLDWSGAQVVAEGQFAISGDGATTTPGATLTAAGCYGYGASVEGPHLDTVNSPVGAAGETVLIDAPPAELTITKRVDKSQAVAGKPLHYTIEVENKGAGPATDTVVTDTPKSPLEFISAVPSQGSCGNGFPLVCHLGTLAPKATATVEVIATPLAAGKLVNEAEVSSPSTKKVKAAKAEAATQVTIPLKLTKTVAPKSVEAGKPLHYTIAVTNSTPATAHNLKVCDLVPAGLVFVSSKPGAKLENGNYCWHIASLKGHSTVKIQIHARVLAGASGKIVNAATLRGPFTDPRRVTATVRVKPRQVRPGGVTG